MNRNKKNNIMKAYEIIQNAKKEIVDLIGTEASLLYKKLELPEPEEDEAYVIEASDLHRPVSINVEVDNTYLDVEDTCFERKEVEQIIVERDGTVTIVAEDGEYSTDDITIEELVNISAAIELTYEN